MGIAIENPEWALKRWSIDKVYVGDALDTGYACLSNGFQQFGKWDYELGCGTATYATLGEAQQAIANHFCTTKTLVAQFVDVRE